MEFNPLRALILQIQTTTEKIKLIGYLILGEIKFFTSKMKILRKRAQKVKKDNNFTFHDDLRQCRS